MHVATCVRLIANVACQVQAMDGVLQYSNLTYMRDSVSNHSQPESVVNPLRHPRNAIWLGVFFVALAAGYWAVQALGSAHVDFAGVTILAASGWRPA